MTAAKVRLAMAAMGQPETKVSALCRELGVTRQTLYRHVGPDGALRLCGRKLLEGRHESRGHGALGMASEVPPRGRSGVTGARVGPSPRGERRECPAGTTSDRT
jgi:hypothetical protein